MKISDALRIEGQHQITLTDLELAINRARQHLPAQGAEHKLATEVSVLANLYGKMIYYKQIIVPMELLTDVEQMTLLQWVTFREDSI